MQLSTTTKICKRSCHIQLNESNSENEADLDYSIMHYDSSMQ